MTEHLKLLYVHTGSDLYGAGKCLLRLCERLNAEGHSVAVVTPETGPLSESLKAIGIPVHVIPSLPVVTRRLRRPMALFRFVAGLPISLVAFARLLKRLQPDIVHVNTAVVLGPQLVARWQGIPVVWHIREFFSEFPVAWKVFRRTVLWWADSVVCVSDAVASQFPSGVEKVTTIYDGFPIAEFPEVPEEAVARFRSKYDLNGDRTVVLVGRIKLQRKGQDVFARAAAIVSERMGDVSFVCVGGVAPGNESHLRDLERLVKQLGLEERWIVTGELSDVRPAYAAADIVVLASALPEPFGGVVVESMAMGRSVIGTNLGGTPEQIEHQITGFLVEANDPEALATRICDLLDDDILRTRMGRAGRHRFLELFEYEQFHERVVQLYRDLLASENRHV